MFMVSLIFFFIKRYSSQFQYGEDGFEVCKSQYLSQVGIPFLVDNKEGIKLADVSVSNESARSEVEAAQRGVRIPNLLFTYLFYF